MCQDDCFEHDRPILTALFYMLAVVLAEYPIIVRGLPIGEYAAAAKDAAPLILLVSVAITATLGMVFIALFKRREVMPKYSVGLIYILCGGVIIFASLCMVREIVLSRVVGGWVYQCLFSLFMLLFALNAKGGVKRIYSADANVKALGEGQIALSAMAVMITAVTLDLAVTFIAFLIIPFWREVLFKKQE